MLDPEFRGKGYAFDALRCSIDYGLRELGLVKVVLGTGNENLAMRGLMEKKFGLEGEVTVKDKFGNDLVWKIDGVVWESWLEGREGSEKMAQ